MPEVGIELVTRKIGDDIRVFGAVVKDVFQGKGIHQNLHVVFRVRRGTVHCESQIVRVAEIGIVRRIVDNAVERNFERSAAAGFQFKRKIVALGRQRSFLYHNGLSALFVVIFHAVNISVALRDKVEERTPFLPDFTRGLFFRAQQKSESFISLKRF